MNGNIALRGLCNAAPVSIRKACCQHGDSDRSLCDKVMPVANPFSYSDITQKHDSRFPDKCFLQWNRLLLGCSGKTEDVCTDTHHIHMQLRSMNRCLAVADMTDSRVHSLLLQGPDAVLKTLPLHISKRLLLCIASSAVYQMGIHPRYVYVWQGKQRKQLFYAARYILAAIHPHTVKAGIQLQMHGYLYLHADTACRHMGQ